MIEFVLAGECGAQAGSVVIGGVHAETFALQEALQQVDQGVVVVDDEQAIHRIYFAFSASPVR